MKFNTTSIYIVYGIILLLIASLVYHIATKQTYKEGVTTQTPSITATPVQGSNSAAETSSNKTITNEIGQETQESSLRLIQSKITECETLIGKINSKLPNSISEISPGTVTMSDVSDVQFIVENTPVENTNPFDTSKTMLFGSWKIGAILPKGKMGATGPKGDDGVTGIPGPIGETGVSGQRGPWGTPM